MCDLQTSCKIVSHPCHDCHIFVPIVPPPKKITIGLLALITLQIVKYSEYALGLWNYNYNYLHLGENPIRFGSVVTKK